MYKRIEIMETRKDTPIKQEITLIDTYNVDYDDYVEDFKEHCEINGYELRGEGHNMEGLYMGGRISFLEWVGQCISDDCQEFWNDLLRVKKGSYIDYYVVTGSLGLWYGRRGGICHTFNNLYDALCKCSEDAYDIIGKCDGKKIEFENHHHDGTNCFTIYRIGWETCEKIEWWDNEKDGDVFDFIEKHALPITYEMLGR